MTILYTNPVYSSLVERWQKTGFTRPEIIQKRYENLLAKLKTPDEISKYVEAEYFSCIAQDVSIVENDYPYELPNNFIHFVVWGRGNVTNTDLKAAAFAQFDISRIVCMFSNHLRHRSVYGVKHIHLIIDNFEE